MNEEGKIVITWNHDRSQILAVTRQNEEGQILKVIADSRKNQSTAVGDEPPTNEQIAHAKTIPSDKQTPFDAACEILGHLRSIGATYYYTHRMQQVIQALPGPVSQPPVQGSQAFHSVDLTKEVQ